MKLLRFTLRDLFWLVLLCAVGLAWLIDRDRLRVNYNEHRNVVMRAKHHEDELRRAIEGEGYSAEWDESRNAYKLTKHH